MGCISLTKDVKKKRFDTTPPTFYYLGAPPHAALLHNSTPFGCFASRQSFGASGVSGAKKIQVHCATLRLSDDYNNLFL